MPIFQAWSRIPILSYLSSVLPQLDAAIPLSVVNWYRQSKDGWDTAAAYAVARLVSSTYWNNTEKEREPKFSELSRDLGSRRVYYNSSLSLGLNSKPRGPFKFPWSWHNFLVNQRLWKTAVLVPSGAWQPQKVKNEASLSKALFPKE